VRVICQKNKIYFFICLLQFLFIPCACVEIIQDVKVADCTIYSWLKTGLLNGTRIELKFGSYRVKVLAQDLNLGICLSSLYSEHKNEKITRTLALTRYKENIDDHLKMAHKEILEGGSIDSTLKKYGFILQKRSFF